MGRRRGRRSTLAAFVQSLEGLRVVVELRYDTIVRGQLLGADDHLNLQLGQASYKPLEGPERQMEFCYVKGRHVRFIHLPGNLDPAAAMEQHRRRVAAALKGHERAQAQAAQQPGARLQKGAGPAELGPAAAQHGAPAGQQGRQQQQQQPAGMDIG